MAETTTIRVSCNTHARVTRLAAERHETMGETVSRAIRALRQDAMARTSRRSSPTTRRRGSMLTPGDVVELGLGVPAGSEAGLRSPRWS